MKELIDKLETYENVIELQKGIDRLCMNYNSLAPLRYTWSELYFALPEEFHNILEKYKEDDPYPLINYLIMKYGRGERVVKYYFARQFFYERNLTCLFEYNVFESRLDFGRINGSTYAYEIKTENDSLDKLITQISNYEKVFDYLYIVIHEKHLTQAKKLLNSKIGIIIYDLNGKETKFVTEREAKINKAKQKKELIKIFNSSDLTYILKDLNLKDPKSIDAKRNLVARKVSKQCLFNYYRLILHKKYFNKWMHIIENRDRLLPIDFQTIYSAGEKISIFRKTQKQQLDSEA